MTHRFLSSAFLFLSLVSVASLTACGSAQFTKGDSNRSGAASKQTLSQEDQAKLNAGCVQSPDGTWLGGPIAPVPNAPNQGPIVQPVPVSPCGPGPVLQPQIGGCSSGCNRPILGGILGQPCQSPCASQPCQNPCGIQPCQSPCARPVVQNPCGSCDNGRGLEPYPRPFPPQAPVQQPVLIDQCGKNGNICDGPGHPGQFPGADINGRPIPVNELNACMGALRQSGVNTVGLWPIEVREVSQVSVLSDSIFEDNSRGPRIVILKDVNVLGTRRYRFLNPQALYCVQAVSVLQENRITSCFSNNVVFGNSVNVFTRVNSQVVACQ